MGVGGNGQANDSDTLTVAVAPSSSVSILFDLASVVTPSGTVASYRWLRDNATVGQTKSITLQFSEGDYVVRLRVTDSVGGLGSTVIFESHTGLNS